MSVEGYERLYRRAQARYEQLTRNMSHAACVEIVMMARRHLRKAEKKYRLVWRTFQKMKKLARLLSDLTGEAVIPVV